MSVAVGCKECRTVHAIPSGRQGMHFRCKRCGCVNEVPSLVGDQAGGYALAPIPELGAGRSQIEGGAVARDQALPEVRKSHVYNLSRIVSLESRLERESLWLIVLSLADLLLTYALLRRGAGFYESNPVAQWFFARWNMTGMTIFKFGLIGMIIIIIIESKRPGWGRAILGLGCVAAGTVVVYSIKLLTAMGA
jgi:hypothetical protein